MLCLLQTLHNKYSDKSAYLGTEKGRMAQWFGTHCALNRERVHISIVPVTLLLSHFLLSHDRYIYFNCIYFFVVWFCNPLIVNSTFAGPIGIVVRFHTTK